MLIVGCLVPAMAHAALGGPATIAADGDRLQAQVASVAAGSYMRHDLTRSNTGMVHEFTNGSGQVFAVTWHGPGKPDLRLLLGSYFAALPAGTGRSLHALRRPVPASRPDVQVQTSGHMGWFSGVAFIPSLAPAGFAPADLARQP